MKKTKSPLILNVVKAKYISDYKLWVEFNDGTAGEVDLKKALYGRLAPLTDLEQFKKFQVQHFTICWSDQIDLAPEYIQDFMLEQAGVIISK